MAEILSQAEIDSLIEGNLSGQNVDIQSSKLGDTEKAKKLDKAISRMTARVIFYRENGYPWDIIREAENELRQAGFNRWLYKHNINKKEYVALVRRLLKERGLAWCPWNPPGYKLVANPLG